MPSKVSSRPKVRRKPSQARTRKRRQKVQTAPAVRPKRAPNAASGRESWPEFLRDADPWEHGNWQC
jgi:hypothetical protein